MKVTLVVAQESARRAPTETTREQIFAAAIEQIEEQAEPQSATALFSKIELALNVPKIYSDMDTNDNHSALMPTNPNKIKAIQRSVDLQYFKDEDEIGSLALLDPFEHETNKSCISWQSENVGLKTVREIYGSTSLTGDTGIH